MINNDWLHQLNHNYRSSVIRSLWQYGVTATALIVLWTLMYLSLSYSYWLTLLLAIPTSGFFVRMFIFQHDCGHGSFFKTKRMNSYFGRLASLVTLTPFYYWKEHHAAHHRLTGNLDFRNVGDIWLMTTKEYENTSWFRRFLYRMYRNPIVFLNILSPLHSFLISALILLK